MKYLIATIRRGRKPQMRYPSVWNAEEIQSELIGPIIYDGGIGAGRDTEECLVSVHSDDLADRYASDADIRIASESVANAWLSRNPRVIAMPEERVTDVNRMIAIQAKKAAGQSLSQEDKDAVNPDKPVRGINRREKNVRGLFR
jgi:hypothetical protein